MQKEEFDHLLSEIKDVDEDQKSILLQNLIYNGGLSANFAPVVPSTLKNSFNILWQNHPSTRSPSEYSPCRDGQGQPSFSNQCAIRFGVAITNSGFDFANYRGDFCWYGHGRTHTLRVEELKDWLSIVLGTRDISRRDRNGNQRTYGDYLNKRGIVACRNFWGDNNQGDHIDLWNGQMMAGGSRDYFERSEEIWFWRMN